MTAAEYARPPYRGAAGAFPAPPAAAGHMTLIAGGAGSGKSACAEALLCALAPPDAERIYLATMHPEGAETRIERHRRARAGKGFRTLERQTGLASLTLPPGCALLLEDIGNLCANELFDPGGAGADAADAVTDAVLRLRARCSVLVLVTNEAGAGGADYAGDTLRWLRTLGTVNCRLAARADAVCEAACGIMLCHKGGAGPFRTQGAADLISGS